MSFANGPDAHANFVGPQFVCHCKCGKVWVHKRNAFLKPTSTCFKCGSQVTPIELQPGQGPMQSTKCTRQVLINTCCEYSKAKMFATDIITGKPVLFDSGAEVSIISGDACGTWEDLDPANMYELRGVTGGTIKALGQCLVPLDPGFSKTFVHELIVVDMHLPYIILGQDFMRDHGILLDPKAEAAYLSSSSDAVHLSFFDDVTNSVQEVSTWQIATIMKACVIDSVTVGKSNKSRAARRGEELCLDLFNSFPELTATPDYTKLRKHDFTLDIVFSQDLPITQRPRRFSIEEHGKIPTYL